MSSQTIDYDALAQQHGGTAGIDYDALAAQHGGMASGVANPEPQKIQPSIGQRVRENFASGLGIVSDEDAKNFFAHPINTLMNSLDAQGQLAIKAKDAYAKGDYKGALMYGLNYLVPFIGQQTAKAGEQLNEGDYAGGISRTVGAAVPIIAGSPEARAVASDAASSLVQKAGSVTPKQAAQLVGGTSGAVAGHGTLSAPGAYYGAKTAGNIAEGLLGKDRANAPIWDLEPQLKNLSDALDKSQQVHADVAESDATESNVPYAGESARGRKLPTAQASPASAQAQPVQAQPVPAGPTPNWPPAQRPVVPSVQNIRERIAQTQEAENAPNRPTADTLEDHAIQQEMNQDLERHGWAVDSEARREFIARNSTGMTKAELTGAAEKPVRYTKTPGVPSIGTGAVEDLTDLLQKSLDAAKKAKGQQ